MTTQGIHKKKFLFLGMRNRAITGKILVFLLLAFLILLINVPTLSMFGDRT